MVVFLFHALASAAGENTKPINARQNTVVVAVFKVLICSFSLCFRIRVAGSPLDGALWPVARDEEEALRGPSPSYCAKSPAIISLRDHAWHLNDRLMQLLPRGMQKLPRPQRKTAPEQLMDQQELLPMRLARVRAGDPASGRLECCVKSVLGRSASYSSFAGNARRLPQS
jgi:hypothetical protein